MVAVCKDRRGSDRPTKSINEDKHGGTLRRLHHILKLPFSRRWLFQFAGHVRHRFEEAQEQAALHRVIHLVAVRKDSGGDPAVVNL